MSSPYPQGTKTIEDKQIYAMKQAAIWLSRIDSENTDINISEISSHLDKHRKKYKEEYFENHLHDIAIDDYVFNQVEDVKELFRTDSLDKRIQILDKAKNNIMDRFGYYQPKEPTYDELEEYIRQNVKEAKNSKSYGDYYDDLELE